MRPAKTYCIFFYFSCFYILGVSSCVEKPDESVTFSKDIAPLIFKNCTPCHRSNRAGPFNLVTYEEVKKKAKIISYVVQTRYMPPWPADVSYRHFSDEMYLPDEDILLLKKWVELGTPLGDTSLLPPPPVFTDSTYIIGKPDLVLKMPQRIFLPGDQIDKFKVMKFPYELPHDTFVRLIRFIPDNRKLLHHMNAHLVQYDHPLNKAQSNDSNWVVENRLGESDEIHHKLGLLYDDGTYPRLKPSVCNYLPGVESTVFPDGIGGFRLTRKGALYVNDMHYGPSAKDQYDSSYFEIYFSKDPPERPLAEFQMGTLGISKIIPPLAVPPDSIKTFVTEMQITMSISILTITPHMHLLGKSFLAYAIIPSGDTIPLIRIPKWDFRWQYFYKLKKPLKIPSGSIIRAEGTYDNTTKNINNPYFPPRLIIERNGSMRTTDEMFQLIVQYLAYQEGDENMDIEIIKPMVTVK